MNESNIKRLPSTLTTQKAVVNVVSFCGTDEIEHGDIEIPLPAFEAAMRESTCTITWSRDSVSVIFGDGEDGISLHIFPKGD